MKRRQWFRCEDRGRANDMAMVWHLVGCPLCAAAARALGRGDVLAEMAARRAPVTPAGDDDNVPSWGFNDLVPEYVS